MVVAAVADEEHASLGIQEVLAAGVRADAAIVTEPTHGEIVIAHKGFVWTEIEVRGRAAHGSMPDKGVDAIVAAAPVLTRHRRARRGARRRRRIRCSGAGRCTPR